MAASVDKTEYDNALFEKVNTALSFHKAGNVIESLKAYDSILKSQDAVSRLTPQTASSLFGNYAALLMQTGQYDQALENFEASLQYFPDNPTGHYNIAVLMTSKLDQHKKALSHCIKALKLDPKNHKILHLMGNIFQSLGRDDDAQAYFIKAEEAASDSSSQSQSSRGIPKHHEQTPSKDPSSQLNTSNMKYALSVLSSLVGSSTSITHNDSVVTMTCLSVKPLIFHVSNFLSIEECSDIISQAKKSNMEKSFVMGGSQMNSSASSPYRQSFTTWLPLNDLLRDIQKRVSQLTNIPISYLQHKAEDLQVVKYEKDGQFKVHHDSSAFHPRLMTILMYLTSSSESTDTHLMAGLDSLHGKDYCDSEVSGLGGQTWFPYAGENNILTIPETVTEAINDINHLISPSLDRSSTLPGVTIQPRRGDAIIFFNYESPDFEKIDIAAVHAGQPIIQGEKWIANYWIQNDPILLNSLLLTQGKVDDETIKER